jgi:CubicO group peptidase (beta-lactamase class C family)
VLALGDAVINYLPRLAVDPAPGVERITVTNLLNMTSGIVYEWDDPDADHPDDPARDILSTALGGAPGATFAYRGANSYLLSRVIHATTGSDLRDYLLARLFQPLGINNPQWLRCPRGFSLGAVGLQLRTSELARVGQLLRDDGRWLDQQVVPAEYIDTMTVDAVPTGGHIASRAVAPHPDNARYGRHVWLCARDSAWRMDGIYGQFSIVLPNHQACVTVTAQYEGPTTDILDAVWSDIVQALS